MNKKDLVRGRGIEKIIFNLEFDGEEFFFRLYDRFSPALFGLIVSRVNNAGAAEIVLKRVFLQAWHRRKLYNPKQERLFTWLYKITENACLDYQSN